MLVQFGNNWIKKIPRTAKSDSAYGLVQFGGPRNFSHPNYFQIGQHVVLLHIQTTRIKFTLTQGNNGKQSIRRDFGSVNL